ncbi:MAG: response regulator transcription factor [Bacteroidota bacterium]
MITIALADDHNVMRKGLASLLQGLGYGILYEAENGKEFIDKTTIDNLPQLAILDINMPVMDGYETSAWLKKNHPGVKVLALSMYNDEAAILRMIKNGARGYILKDSDIADVCTAIDAIISKGFFYSELITSRLINSISHLDSPADAGVKELLDLNSKEIEFLKLCCTEMSYKEIGTQMHLSTRTIEGYRDALCAKLKLHTRIGLAMFAIKTKIAEIN